ncbi:hypothetical protein HBB16_06590 [Pseudonocardia sp. MCCB 268]|nr:hypothetical protein [Pseudonocardia cytotoxica]
MKAVAQNGKGLSGGHPDSNWPPRRRQSWGRGPTVLQSRIPVTLDEIRRPAPEPGQGPRLQLPGPPGEVFAMTWRGGGGYGDPLTRDPAAVARDVRDSGSPERDARVYGVVADSGIDGGVDEGRHHGQQDRQRAARLTSPRSTASPATDRPGWRPPPRRQPGRDDRGTSPAGTAASLGTPEDRLAVEVLRGLARGAGPQIVADPTDYVDADVVFHSVQLPVVLDGAVRRDGADRPPEHAGHAQAYGHGGMRHRAGEYAALLARPDPLPPGTCPRWRRG